MRVSIEYLDLKVHRVARFRNLGKSVMDLCAEKDVLLITRILLITVMHESL